MTQKKADRKKEGEFSFIHRFFAPLAGRGAWNLEDDAALLPPLTEAGSRFVVSVDNLAEDVHFFSEDPPKTIAQKLLRRNLSDMVAMGAVPRGYFLSLAFNSDNLNIETWFKAFHEGLAEDQEKYDLTLLGGDTSCIKGKIFLSMTIIGEAKEKAILRRNGACPGDELWVTGTIGNAALGLAVREGKIRDMEGFFAKNYLLPNPPVNFRLGGIASAGIDISDGLLQDAGHLANYSNVKIVLDLSEIPLVPQSLPYFANDPSMILEGGDDYQLLFTINPCAVPEMKKQAREKNIRVSRIGTVHEGTGIMLRNAAHEQQLYQGKGGWRHF